MVTGSCTILSLLALMGCILWMAFSRGVNYGGLGIGGLVVWCNDGGIELVMVGEWM